MNEQMHDDRYYEELADRAERGELCGIPGTQLYGEDAAAVGREMIFAATGATTVADAMHAALGRP